MCLLALHFHALEECPILIAANREELFARPSLPPAIHDDPARSQRRVLCGTDAVAGGTWLGINDLGVVVAVTNRRLSAKATSRRGAKPRSRGLLCRDLLLRPNAQEAAELGIRELLSGRYLGANYLAVDARAAFAVHGGDQIQLVELPPGLHFLTNADVNDPADRRQSLARRLFAEASYGNSGEFVAAARRVCSQGPTPEGVSIVLRGQDRGTVSTTILTRGAGREDCRYEYRVTAPQPGPSAADIDCSDALRSLLGT